jgi:O-methyltransferase involved in polyketide biosynthesis
LKSAGVSVPSNVRFAQIDFSREMLAEKMGHLSLDHNKPLFASWLGVNQYLTRDAVTETLRAVAAWRGGSEIALTYVADDWSDLDSEGRAAMALAESNAAACGEPWRSKFSQVEFTRLARACGFSQCQQLPLKDAGEPLFANRADLLRPAGGSALVLAWT